MTNNKQSDSTTVLAFVCGAAVGFAIWTEQIHLPAEIQYGLRSLAEKTPFGKLDFGPAVMAALISFAVFLLVLKLLRFRLLVWGGRSRQRLAEKTLKKSTASNEYTGTTEQLKKLYK